MVSGGSVLQPGTFERYTREMAIRAEDLPHFSVDEYLVLAEAAPEALERTELIDGVIYRVSPESFLHAVAVKWKRSAAAIPVSPRWDG
jgi:hypothetical protein